MPPPPARPVGVERVHVVAEGAAVYERVQLCVGPGGAERVQLMVGDMCALKLADSSFNLVLDKVCPPLPSQA